MQLDDNFWKKVSTGDLQHALLAFGRGRRILKGCALMPPAPNSMNLDSSGSVLTALGSLLALLGVVLGRSWGLLGRSWAILGRSWLV